MPTEPEPVTVSHVVQRAVEVCELAARAEFDGRPPEHVEAWLNEQGVSP